MTIEELTQSPQLSYLNTFSHSFSRLSLSPSTTTKKQKSIGRNSSSWNPTCRLTYIWTYLYLLPLDFSEIPVPLCIVNFPICGLYPVSFISLQGTNTITCPFLFIFNFSFSTCCFLEVFIFFIVSAFRNLINNFFFTPNS